MRHQPVRSGDRRLQRIIDRNSRSGASCFRTLAAPSLAIAFLLVTSGVANHQIRTEKQIIGRTAPGISVEEATRFAAGDHPVPQKLATRIDPALHALVFAPPAVAAPQSPSASLNTAEMSAPAGPSRSDVTAPSKAANLDVLPPSNPFRPRRDGGAAAPRAPQPAARQVATTQPPEQPGFFEKMFGPPAKPEGPALAYARPDDDSIGGVFSRKTMPNLNAGSQTAVYDIEAKVVILPNGKRLEAHSGLGQFMDDPDNVHRRMKGATPPNTYNLVMRESLFHGVRAIRLLPVDSGKMFGRDGILAHTYMLGPRGDSNGCVSFRDYDAFLQAFLRGEIKRMVVVRNVSMLNTAQAAGASRT